MHIKHCIRLVYYNLTSKKRRYFRLFVNILLLSAALTAWLVMTTAMTEAHDQYIYGTASANEEYLLLQVNANGAIEEDSDYALLEELRTWETLGAPVIYSEPHLPDVMEKDNWVFVNNRLVTLCINGTEYEGINDYSYDFTITPDSDEGGKTVPFEVGVVYTEMFFTENDYTEFHYKYPQEKWLLCGDAALHPGELLITDYMLEKFGISGDWDQWLGAELSIVIDGELLLEHLRIGGIVNSQLYRCSGLIDMPQIMIVADQDVHNRLQSDIAYARIPILGYGKIMDVLVDLQEKGINVGYFSWKRAEYYYNINAFHLVIERLVAVFGVLVFLAIVLNLYHLLQQAVDAQCEQYGILKAVGMRPWALHLIAYTEQLVLIATAIVSSLFLAMLLLQFMDKMLYTMLNVHLSLSLLQYIKIGLLALVIMAVVVTIITYLVLRRYLRSKPLLLLHGQTGR